MMLGNSLLKGHGINTSAMPQTPVTFEGAAKIAAFNPTWSCVRDLVNNKYYYGLMSVCALQRDPWIIKFDPVKNRIEQVFRIAIGLTPFGCDTHRGPVIAVGSDGHVHVVCEKLDASEGHGGDMLYYKTTTAGNIATLTLKQTFTGRWSYCFVRVSGSNVFVCARGSTSTTLFVREQQWYYNSTDGGDTFGAAVKLYDSDDTQKVCYIFEQHDYSGGICMVLNERDNDLSNWTFISFIKGNFNSNVWTNADGSFSKNVSSSGYITRAEMMDDCLVVLSSDTANIAVNQDQGCIKSDGATKLLVSIQTLTGETYEGNPETYLDELRFYYFSGGTWQYNVVDIPTGWEFYWVFDRYLKYLNCDEDFDDILFIDSANNNNLYILRSSDNFDTHTSSLKQVGNGNYRLCGVSYNSTDADERLIIITDTKGDKFEFAAETALDFSNIIAIQ